MPELQYSIGLDDRELEPADLDTIVALLSSPTTLTERFTRTRQALFQDPDNATQLFYILDKEALFQYLDEFDEFNRQQRDWLQKFNKSLETGFKIGITAFYLIRQMQGSYEPALRVEVPPQTAAVTFTESFTTSSSPYEVVTRLARINNADQEFTEARRVGLIKGSHISAYLLQRRQQQLTVEFETSTLEEELESLLVSGVHLPDLSVI
jgi:hypothetical protein